MAEEVLTGEKLTQIHYEVSVRLDELQSHIKGLQEREFLLKSEIKNVESKLSAITQEQQEASPQPAPNQVAPQPPPITPVIPRQPTITQPPKKKVNPFLFRSKVKSQGGKP